MEVYSIGVVGSRLYGSCHASFPQKLRTIISLVADWVYQDFVEMKHDRIHTIS
jgi:hypothetical protein